MINIGKNTKYDVKSKVNYIKETDHGLNIALGTYSKYEKDGETIYKNSSWWAKPVGKAAEQLANAQKGDTIIIHSAGIERINKKDENNEYKQYPANIIIFDAEIEQKNEEYGFNSVNTDEELPF